MKTFKKIGGIFVDVLIVIVFVVSVLVIIANVTTDKENGEQPNVFGYVINTVQSDSMSGTFEKGDLVIGKIPDENTEIIVGESIIMFEQQEGNIRFNNTHRVVDSNKIGSVTFYQTQGDNRERCPEPDREWKSFGDIKAVYSFSIPYMGSVLDFIKSPLGFVLILVVPMLAFIAWQVYKLITLYLKAKKEQMLEEVKDGVSDAAKEAIIQEFLKAQQAAAAKAEAEQAENAAAEQEAAQEEDKKED